MSLKDQLLDDLTNVFFNVNDFAEPHSFNNKQMLVIEDDDRVMQYKEVQGLWDVNKVLFVRAEDISPPPEAGMVVIYDKQQMQVASCRIVGELLEIALQGWGG